MLIFALCVALIVVLGLIVIRRRHTSALSSLACLIGAALMLILLQDSGLLPHGANPGSPAPPPIEPRP